jgi:hypothetical protein
MKKTLLVVSITVVLLVTLGLAGFAYAQSQTQPTPGTPYGWGMMGGYAGQGMMGGRGRMAGFNGQYGPMHTYMVDAVAEKLGLTSEVVQSRLAAGETMWQIASSTGLSDDQVRTVLEEAHDVALDKAVEAGLLTQEQADWMDQHMEQMWANNGGMPCQGGAASAVRRGPGGRWSR